LFLFILIFSFFGISKKALEEVTRKYSYIQYDESKLFEVNYNTLIACRFLEICYQVGKDKKPIYYPDAPGWYKALMVYTDWLTWDLSTYQYADWIYKRYKECEFG